ncbi:zinc transporter ZIP11 isoform X8 [Symphalangus syndactylus]|uniref:zinc transporter ZIP11 isoform X8 n=1 Tax=Symphalangus syndactylus TaxID=9590 RepID=UPI003003ED30
MLQGHSSVFQALLGTFFAWGMTAAGAALVFVFSSGQRRILDGSLGFAAGVMLAASYWSLLAPAVEMATSSGGFGAFAFFPVAVGFTLGAAFVYLADLLMPHLGAAEDPQTALALNFGSTLMNKKSDPEGPALLFPESELSIRIDKSENGEAYQRKKAAATGLPEGPAVPVPSRGNLAQPGGSSWRRIALLILAITIHNVPAYKHLAMEERQTGREGRGRNERGEKTSLMSLPCMILDGLHLGSIECRHGMGKEWRQRSDQPDPGRGNMWQALWDLLGKEIFRNNSELQRDLSNSQWRSSVQPQPLDHPYSTVMESMGEIQHPPSPPPGSNWEQL